MRNLKVKLNLIYQVLLFGAVSFFRKTDSSLLKFSDFLKIYCREGRRSAVDAFYEKYLIKQYRLRSRVKLGGASISFFRKFEPIFSNQLKEKLKSQMPTKTRILLMREGAMGDVIMMTPIVRELYLLRNGNVDIDVMTSCGGVFKGNPYVKSVISIKNGRNSISSYDAVFDLNGTYERDSSEHPVDVYARHTFGMHVFSKKLDIFFNDQDLRSVKEKLAGISAPYLVCHKPNHNWPNRNLDNEFWTDFVESLQKSTGYSVVIIGASGDYGFDRINTIYDHRGFYDIQETAALIEMSAGFVGVDAGPSHIAAATNAPVFTFYTCAHHDVRKPLRASGVFVPITPDVDCYGCMQRSPFPRVAYFCERGDNICVKSFSIEKSVKLISEALKAG
jgi:ADP-heptose:LPS heptosyltransferase